MSDLQDSLDDSTIESSSTDLFITPHSLLSQESNIIMYGDNSASNATVPDRPSSKSKNFPTKWFGKNIRNYTNSRSSVPVFDPGLRKCMEPHINKARKTREDWHKMLVKKIGSTIYKHSTVRVPYPSLRHERSFLFDLDTYPLHQILADTIGVEDLSLLHQYEQQDKKALLSKLLNPQSRRDFHECYDNFVTSICIPLIHSQAVSESMFSIRNSDSKEICYRYQAFPCLRVMQPGEFSIGPHCDMAYGHSIGNINFHIPLTPTFGTNALYTESHPGREDWHPLTAKSNGLGYVFDGARCLHFSLENTTDRTRVSLDFRIAISRKNDLRYNGNHGTGHSIFMRKYNLDGTDFENRHLDDVLCSEAMLEDNYSAVRGYYDEVFVNIGTTKYSRIPSVVRKRANRKRLLTPDRRVGFPF